MPGNSRGGSTLSHRRNRRLELAKGPIRYAIGPVAAVSPGHVALWNQLHQTPDAARVSPIDGLTVLVSWRGARPPQLPESFDEDVAAVLAAWDVAAAALLLP